MVREGKAIGSRALTYPELVRLTGRTELWTGPNGEQYEREFVERFVKDFQRQGSGRQNIVT